MPPFVRVVLEMLAKPAFALFSLGAAVSCRSKWERGRRRRRRALGDLGLALGVFGDLASKGEDLSSDFRGEGEPGTPPSYVLGVLGDLATRRAMCRGEETTPSEREAMPPCLPDTRLGLGGAVRGVAGVGTVAA